MELNDIKKALYKEKPWAFFEYVDKDGVHYHATLENNTYIRFTIPTNDLGDAKFFQRMEAKYLIRYITSNEILDDKYVNTKPETVQYKKTESGHYVGKAMNLPIVGNGETLEELKMVMFDMYNFFSEDLTNTLKLVKPLEFLEVESFGEFDN